eukprot:CAMPEP_0196769432 /NCGR_PEP_ID=MMETSP1104-20130614/539_1 /TAXON_ID=33652 /ORGANISM="Cafeteria sp., Strain Caron Lab Isolate" /LENGTH=35 /DNA_ID= /DNA_START= /DNA_END= /DNA_ORIENTATION=
MPSIPWMEAVAATAAAEAALTLVLVQGVVELVQRR